jgi:hypothetical protein
MEPTRGLSVHFNDGSKLSFGFPKQEANAAGIQLRLEDFLKSNYLMLVSDGVLTMFPVANIKAIRVAVGEGTEEVKMPKHVIRGATLTHGDL